MIPLYHILRKCTVEYKLSKTQEKDQSSYVHGQYQTVYEK